MATNVTRQCLPQMKACALRACKLNADGTTLIGASSSYVSAALVTLGITPVYKDGTNISETDACGASFVDVNSAPSLTRYDVDVDVWSTDPHLLSVILADGDVLVHPSGGQSGFAYPAPGPITGQFSLEFWQQIIENNLQDADFPWAHWVLPYLKNVKLGKRDVKGDGVSHTIFTAEAYVNANFFNGPGDDWAVASDKPVQWIPQATLPTADCAFDAIAS